MYFKKEKQYRTPSPYIGHNFHFEQAQPYVERNSVIFYLRTNTKYVGKKWAGALVKAPTFHNCDPCSHVEVAIRDFY